MGVLDFIFRRAPAETDPPPPIALTAAAIAHGAASVIVETDEMPAEQEDVETAPPTAEFAVQYLLEPFFLMIEYTDANGTFSRRRITTRKITEFDGSRTLQAICHERNALRTFRLDRISCLISQDGEVEEPSAWFAHILENAEVHRIPAPLSSGKPSRKTGKTVVDQAHRVSPYTALRRELAPALMFLIASARSDDVLHLREIDRILRYAEDEMMTLRDAGLLPAGIEVAAFEKLERTIRRLRPTREDLIAAAGELSAWPAPRLQRLACAVADTAKADGMVDEIEAALADDLRDLGTRRHGFGWTG